MGLERDGDPIVTPACVVGPVRRGGVPLFLKVTDEPEERAGSRALAVLGRARRGPAGRRRR